MWAVGSWRAGGDTLTKYGSSEGPGLGSDAIADGVMVPRGVVTPSALWPLLAGAWPSSASEATTRDNVLTVDSTAGSETVNADAVRSALRLRPGDVWLPPTRLSCDSSGNG